MIIKQQSLCLLVDFYMHFFITMQIYSICEGLNVKTLNMTLFIWGDMNNVGYL